MSMYENDEQLLRDRLDLELGAMTPSVAPTEAIVGRGRGFVRRRRQVWGGALAAVIALGVATSLLTASTLRPTPSAPASTTTPTRTHSVTVGTVPKEDSSGVIGTGTADGIAWTAKVSANGNQDLYEADLSGVNAGMLQDPSGQVDSKNPLLYIEGIGAEATVHGVHETVVVSLGEVPSNVGTMDVQYANGTTLSYKPVLTNGHEYIAFARPQGLDIERVIVYNVQHQELGYSIPHNDSTSTSFESWYPPGRATTLAPATATIRQAADGPHVPAWSATVDFGPTGACFELSPGESFCQSQQTPAADTLQISTSENPPSGVGTLNAAVSKVVAVLSDGTTVDLPLVSIDGMKAFGYEFSAGTHIVSIATYDSGGKLLVRKLIH